MEKVKIRYSKGLAKTILKLVNTMKPKDGMEVLSLIMDNNKNFQQMIKEKEFTDWAVKNYKQLL